MASYHSISINQWRIKHDIPGTAITITYPETVKQYVFYIGTTLLKGIYKINNKSLLQVGSITKTFINTLILQLEEQGKLKIDDAIVKWFPKYPRWRNVTIRQLLNMISGIYNYSQMFDLSNPNNSGTKKQWQPHELVDIAYHQPDYAKGS